MTGLDEVRVSTVVELFGEILRLDKSPHHNHYRSDWLYRGMTDESWPIASSLCRIGEHHASVEGALLRNFRRYAATESGIDGRSLWNDLAVAQHYGLPTRLVDWTNSPLVALHFALGTEPDPSVDAVIWLTSIRSINLLPESLKQALGNQGAYVFATELLETAVPSLDDLDQMRCEDDFILLIEPPALDQRITNQYAMLTALPDPTESVDEFLRRHPEFGSRIVIPGELKWEARDKLDQFNVTERMLFPGLDGLSNWLRRYYGPGPGSGSADRLPSTSMWED